jgi:hypothetical protein
MDGKFRAVHTAQTTAGTLINFPDTNDTVALGVRLVRLVKNFPRTELDAVTAPFTPLVVDVNPGFQCFCIIQLVTFNLWLQFVAYEF